MGQYTEFYVAFEAKKEFEFLDALVDFDWDGAVANNPNLIWTQRTRKVEFIPNVHEIGLIKDHFDLDLRTSKDGNIYTFFACLQNDECRITNKYPIQVFLEEVVFPQMKNLLFAVSSYESNIPNIIHYDFVDGKITPQELPKWLLELHLNDLINRNETVISNRYIESFLLGIRELGFKIREDGLGEETEDSISVDMYTDRMTYAGYTDITLTDVGFRKLNKYREKQCPIRVGFLNKHFV